MKWTLRDEMSNRARAARANAINSLLVLSPRTSACLSRLVLVYGTAAGHWRTSLVLLAAGRRSLLIVLRRARYPCSRPLPHVIARDDLRGTCLSPFRARARRIPGTLVHDAPDASAGRPAPRSQGGHVDPAAGDAAIYLSTHPVRKESDAHLLLCAQSATIARELLKNIQGLTYSQIEWPSTISIEL
jgi:hypothetical protein